MSEYCSGIGEGLLTGVPASDSRDCDMSVQLVAEPMLQARAEIAMPHALRVGMDVRHRLQRHKRLWSRSTREGDSTEGVRPATNSRQAVTLLPKSSCVQERSERIA